MSQKELNQNLWVAVENTPQKYDPRTARAEYLADVVDYNAFEKMLRAQSKYAYRLRSYIQYFKNWNTLPYRYF